MSKYIDTDKLKAELTKMQFELNAAYRKPQSDSIVRAISLEYDDVISLVTSLQQEQPPKGYDEAYLNECIAKASKTWEGVDADKYLDEVRGREEEQPEVDFEKEMKRYQEHYILVRNKGFSLDWMDIETTARHFYELGRLSQTK